MIYRYNNFYLFLFISVFASLNTGCTEIETTPKCFPDEVQNAIVQQVERMLENPYLWEGEMVPTADVDYNPQTFVSRCMGGSLGYNFSMDNQPYGGWLVKTEIDLIGDREKEIIWQIITPDTGAITYLHDVWVYTKGGDFLFHAPPHIVFRKSKGMVLET